jgi:MarR family transcriptional regulator, negative regulator of the multidrug operon emrRAB
VVCGPRLWLLSTPGPLTNHTRLVLPGMGRLGGVSWSASLRPFNPYSPTLDTQHKMTNICASHISVTRRATAAHGHNVMNTANTLGALALAIVDGVQPPLSAASDLDTNDAAAINAIGFRPGCSIRELAGLLTLTHPGAVRCVDRLVNAGLLTRTAGPDARTVALRLTQTGAARWAKLRRARLAWLNTLVSTVPKAQRAAFDRAIAGLLAVLAQTPDDAERICRLCDESACIAAHCPITPDQRNAKESA